MITVNIHEAKSNLSKLLGKVESLHEIIQVCRHGKPVANIVPIEMAIDPLVQHPGIKDIKLYYDPTEPLTEDEWPGEK